MPVEERWIVSQGSITTLGKLTARHLLVSLVVVKTSRCRMNASECAAALEKALQRPLLVVVED